MLQAVTHERNISELQLNNLLTYRVIVNQMVTYIHLINYWGTAINKREINYTNSMTCSTSSADPDCF